METGVIVRLILERGFGFIKPESGWPDLFFHESAVVGDEMPGHGDRVPFERHMRDSRPCAINVQPAIDLAACEDLKGSRP